MPHLLHHRNPVLFNCIHSVFQLNVQLYVLLLFFFYRINISLKKTQEESTFAEREGSNHVGASSIQKTKIITTDCKLSTFYYKFKCYGMYRDNIYIFYFKIPY